MPKPGESAFSIEPIRGMTFGFVGQHGTWATAEAQASMRALAAGPFNWVTLAFAGLQDHAGDPVIRHGPPDTVSDDEILAMANLAHQLGLSVCLKPTVNCRDGTWRGELRFADDSSAGTPTWSEWFERYGNMMEHYAKLAERAGCEMFWLAAR